MKFLVLCTILAASVCGSTALLFGNNEDWNDLKVTWGINPFGSNYVSMPRTEAEAISKGWTKDRDCSNGKGIRYVLKGDRAVMLLFGADGVIAGISAGVPKNMPFNFPSKNIQKFFDDEGDFWSISAYFTDPDSVCSPAQTRLSTGDRVTFKSGTFELTAAYKESDVDSTFWTLGQCFYTMGVHYWADISGAQISETTDVDNFVPIFLQYNSGRLNGFGWAFNGDLKSSRYEHPTSSVLTKFFKKVPSFFNDSNKTGVLSTLHIYLDSTPLFNFC